MAKQDSSAYTVKELKAIAKQRGYKGYSRMKRDELLKLVLLASKKRKTASPKRRKGPTHYLLGFKNGEPVFGSSFHTARSSETREAVLKQLSESRPDIDYKILTAKQHEKLFGLAKYR